MNPVTVPASAADTDVVRTLREVLAQRESAAIASFYEATGAYFDAPEGPGAPARLIDFHRESARLTEAQAALDAFDEAARAL